MVRAKTTHTHTHTHTQQRCCKTHHAFPRPATAICLPFPNVAFTHRTVVVRLTLRHNLRGLAELPTCSRHTPEGARRKKCVLWNGTDTRSTTNAPSQHHHHGGRCCDAGSAACRANRADNCKRVKGLDKHPVKGSSGASATHPFPHATDAHLCV